MSILKIKDINGNFVSIPAFKGAQGQPGKVGVQGDPGYQGIDALYIGSTEPENKNVIWLNPEEEESWINDTYTKSALNEYSESTDNGYSCDYINTILGDIDNRLSELLLITFTVTDKDSVTVTYTAQKGMTWGEWVESEYNVNGFEARYSNDATWSAVYITSNQYLTDTETSNLETMKALPIISGYNYTSSRDLSPV